ncbi:KTSC domain-containing protein [Amycolatopsis sp. NPDC026612]|uniref:KTSC domain-containing protein n=1 Tax=Amycolatopsis sp. NPDC026612 TaxID=3155466 RepID=UPI0033D71F36
MQRQPVTSSNVVSIGYDPGSRTLEIEFREQAIYQYFDVPEDVSDGLLRAPSHGKFIWANIRDRYRYQRVDQRAS